MVEILGPMFAKILRKECFFIRKTETGSKKKPPDFIFARPNKI